MTPRKKRTTPIKTYERRIRTQRQREEELENTNLKKSIEKEGEHEIDVSSTNETSPIVESSPLSPSPDNFIVKSIRYANYNLESMIDRKQKLIKFFSIFFSKLLTTQGRIRFQMSLVYQLLRQIYSYLKEEIWINYNVNTNIPKSGFCSTDRKAFSRLSTGRISYDTTIKHLLKAVKTIDGKTTNLYGFPWAFMCWAFEVVPFLQKKYKVFSKQVSSPRIFRWLLATNNELVNINELFDPPQDSIVHPWIIPTSSEMEMEFFTTFVPKKLTKDDKIEKLEMDLNGVVAIKRDIIIDEHNLDVGGGGASSPIVERVFSGVGDGGGGEFTPNVDRCTDGVDFERGGDFGDISGDFGVGTSSPIDENVPCLQETPSTKDDRFIKCRKVIVTMKSKRGIRQSSKISHPYTPDYVKRTKRQISVALSSARKKKKGKVNETIIEKELMSGDSKDEGADSNSKRS
ncbi:hypothetical protein H5410_012086 [Solanum commersonii]|uniref:Ulp1 protease family, C-terminal catalytic domain containing protein n=1 Tax=Solanum commersonii TaxID=4109 RepID=A0A9J6AR77_SOLCO|nr:hypothetical protein H5410_012086 [Solanum commersonii]